MIIICFVLFFIGYIYVGNFCIVLMNYLIVCKVGGIFILWFDDIDCEWLKQEYVDGIQCDLEWLGLEWNWIECQFDCFDCYVEVVEGLCDGKCLYEVFEMLIELDLKCKKQLNMGRLLVYDCVGLNLLVEDIVKLCVEGCDGYWCFLLDQECIEWIDGIFGDILIDVVSVLDLVLICVDGQVFYIFVLLVDDVDMGVMYIVCGVDYVINIVIQIQIICVLGVMLLFFVYYSLLIGLQGEEFFKCFGVLVIKDLCENGVVLQVLLLLMVCLGLLQLVELWMLLDDLVVGFDLL